MKGVRGRTRGGGGGGIIPATKAPRTATARARSVANGDEFPAMAVAEEALLWRGIPTRPDGDGTGSWTKDEEALFVEGWRMYGRYLPPLAV